MLSFPLPLFALIILSLFGSLFTSVLGSLLVLIFVIAVLDWNRVFRLSRAVAMNIVVLEYVEARALRGEGTWWIIGRPILPNGLPPMISQIFLRLCSIIL